MIGCHCTTGDECLRSKPYRSNFSTPVYQTYTPRCVSITTPCSLSVSIGLRYHRQGTSECSHAICDLCFATVDSQSSLLMRRVNSEISDRSRCYACILAYAATTRCDGLGTARRVNCTTVVPFACALQQNRAVNSPMISDACMMVCRSTSG